MASKSAQKLGTTVEECEELLESLDKNLERLKTMYEQYFLGIQKQAPGVLHAAVERAIRDLHQVQLRNTAHRYRFATLQQKFGSYNAYWRRTLRQIENGTYFRNLSKLGRNAVKTGADIPEEILAAMPKRMREQVLRDREAALANAKRRSKNKGGEEAAENPDEMLELSGDDFVEEEGTNPQGDQPPMELEEDAFADAIALIKEPTELRRKIKDQRGPHALDEGDADFDIDQFFAQVEARPDPPPAAPVVKRSSARVTAQPPEPVVPEAPIQRMAKTERPDRFILAKTNPMGSGAIEEANRTGSPSQPPPTWGKHATQPPPMGSTAPRTTSPGFQAVTPAADPSKSNPGFAKTPAPVAAKASSPGPMGARPAVPAAVPAEKTPAPSISAKPKIGVPASIPSIPKPPSASPTQAASPPPPIAAAPTQPAAPPPRESRPIPVQVQRNTPTEGIAAVATPAPAKPVTRPVPRQRASTDVDPPPRQAPPPGMTEGDVNALYAKYVKAKEMVGEAAGPGAYGKLLKTINSQAPKIMEQYKAKGVDFQIVVKDNQVIIRAKPKT